MANLDSGALPIMLAAHTITADDFILLSTIYIHDCPSMPIDRTPAASFGTPHVALCFFNPVIIVPAWNSIGTPSSMLNVL